MLTALINSFSIQIKEFMDGYTHHACGGTWGFILYNCRE